MIRTAVLSLVSGAVTLYVCLSFFPLLRVEGESMLPTLRPRQWVMLDTLSYRWSRPSYGDKVVVELPHSGQLVVKRVVLLPGDRLRFLGQNLLLPLGMLPLTKRQKVELSGHLRVPRDSYFVVGDNIKHSFDSRDFGFVGLSTIKGRVRP